MARMRRFLGIFINPYMVQTEGLQHVFDNVESAGATAIAFSLRVAQQVNKGEGKRIPDLHVDGYSRKLARPAWGQTELYLKFYSAFESDLTEYRNTRYRPQIVEPPSDIDREIPYRMAEEAHRRGMQAFIQLHPLIPPNVQPENQPMYPDGTVPKPPQVSMYGNPADPQIREYGIALIRDSIKHFPEADGLFIDWIEYGAYNFRDLFTSIDNHTELFARSRGYDWEHIKEAIVALWYEFHRLDSSRLTASRNPIGEIFARNQGWRLFCELKSEVIVGFYRDVRRVLDEMGRKDLKLMARGWPPPWNRMSGLWYEKLPGVCDSATPKLFAFDCFAIPRWYGEVLCRWNRCISETGMLDAIIAWLAMEDDIKTRRFENYHIPAVDEPQPMKVPKYRDRIREVKASVDQGLKVVPFAHAHMPDDMWREMVSMLGEEADEGIWIQMYAYLSETKLRILREIFTGSK